MAHLLRPDGLPTHTIEYIESLGLDPKRIAEDSWDHSGYHEITNMVSPATGVRIRVRRSWPKGFDFDKLMKAWNRDLFGPDPEPQPDPVADLIARFDALRDSGICSPTTRALLDDAQALLST